MFFLIIKVEWSNGETSWIKEKNMPSGLKHAGLEKVVKAVDVVQFGKKAEIFSRLTLARYLNA